MAQQMLNIGSVANDGTGDDLRTGGDKINDNFTELYAGLALTIENESGASYAFVVADAMKHKRFTNAGAVTAEIPLNATEAIPVGARIRITDKSGSGVTLTLEDPGIAVNSRDDAMASAGLNAVFEIEKVATDEWDILGDVTP